MPYTVENYLNNISDISPKCSYIFTKGKNKDLVCGNYINPVNINNQIKYWRCNICKNKTSVNSYFDNILIPNLYIPVSRSMSEQLHYTLDIFDLLAIDIENLLNTRIRENNQLEQQSLLITQPLLQPLTTDKPIINENNREISPPKIFEEDENCDKPCIICLSKAPRFAIVPCGHLIFCDDCGNENNIKKIKKECPVCKISIKSLMRIYT